MGVNKPIPTEHTEQVTFVNWFRSEFPDVLIFAIPNGGFRHAATAERLRLEGVVPGVPDLYIPEWRLWIEMKRANGGRLSPDQSAVIAHLRDVGDAVEVCAGCDAAIDAVLRFRK